MTLLSAMESSSVANNTTVCDVFESVEYSAIAAVRASLGLFSLCCCSVVIILTLLFKKYKYSIQRMVLYVCIAGAVDSVAIVLQKVDYFVQNNATEQYCVFAGCLSLYTSLVELLALGCTSLSLSYMYKRKKELKHYLEAVYILICLILPLFMIWPPFTTQYSYGKSGPWCWIRERDQACQKDVAGIAFQFGLWYLPLLFVSTVVTIAYLYTIMKARKRTRANSNWRGPYNSEATTQLSKTVKSMLAYMPVLYLIVNLIALPTSIHWAIADNPIYPLWVVTAIFPPLRGALIALPFLLRKETRKILNRPQIKAAITDHDAVAAYPARQSKFSDSLAFPDCGDTTLERHKAYRNPSVSFVSSTTSSENENKWISRKSSDNLCDIIEKTEEFIKDSDSQLVTD